MTRFIDCLVIFFCVAAIVLNSLRMLKLLFPDWGLKNPIFHFPEGRVQQFVLLVCTNLILLMGILLQLGYLKKA